MRTRTRAGLAGALVVGGLVLGACGGDDGGGGSSGNPTTSADVVAHGSDDLKFDKSSYSATAGNISIELVDDGSQPHTLLFDDKSVQFKKLEVAGKGKTDTGQVTLQPGTYTIFCDIPGHRAAGMEAKLVVN
jgi:plastocyanin